jgi:hypothetical protein
VTLEKSGGGGGGSVVGSAKFGKAASRKTSRKNYVVQHLGYFKMCSNTE